MNACEDQNRNVPLYLDNELRGEELDDFLVHLSGCTACSVRLEDEQEFLNILHRSRPLYTAPDQLKARVSAAALHVSVSGSRPGHLPKHVLRPLNASLRPLARRFSWSALAAVILLFIAGSVFIPNITQHVRAATFMDTAVTTHRNYLEGKLPLEIESESPESVTAWFAGKVPFDFRLPTSQSAPDGLPAYRQVGARLVNYEDSYAALVTYANKNDRISMLVASSKSAAAAGGEEIGSVGLTFHYHAKAQFNVITWTSHGLTYALVSSLHSSARQSCLVCHQNMSDRDEFREHR